MIIFFSEKNLDGNRTTCRGWHAVYHRSSSVSLPSPLNVVSFPLLSSALYKYHYSHPVLPVLKCPTNHPSNMHQPYHTDHAQHLPRPQHDVYMPKRKYNNGVTPIAQLIATYAKFESEINCTLRVISALHTKYLCKLPQDLASASRTLHNTARFVKLALSKISTAPSDIVPFQSGINSIKLTLSQAQAVVSKHVAGSTAAETPIPHAEQPHYSVFISHAGEDKYTVAIPLREKLRQRGVRAFVDKMDLCVGTVAPDAMLRAVDCATVALFVLSPEFPAKKWPMLELMRFQERYKREAGCGNGKGCPIMIPFFYRLDLKKCDDPRLFWTVNSKGACVFDQFNFPNRIAAGKTSPGQVLESLALLCKWNGVENKQCVNNEDSPNMRQARDRLLDEVADQICKSLQS